MPRSTSKPPIVGPRAIPRGGVTANSEIASPTRWAGTADLSAASITPVLPSWKPTSATPMASW